MWRFRAGASPRSSHSLPAAARERGCVQWPGSVGTTLGLVATHRIQPKWNPPEDGEVGVGPLGLAFGKPSASNRPGVKGTTFEVPQPEPTGWPPAFDAQAATRQPVQAGRRRGRRATTPAATQLFVGAMQPISCLTDGRSSKMSVIGIPLDSVQDRSRDVLLARHIRLTAVGASRHGLMIPGIRAVPGRT